VRIVSGLVGRPPGGPSRPVGVNMGFTHSVETPPAVADGHVDRGDFVAQERLTYLRQVCELLWPAPAVVTMDGGRGQLSAMGIARHRARCSRRPGVSNFGLVPGLRRPPLLVPAEQHVAAAAVHHFSGQRSRAARITTKMFSLVLASGFGDAVLRGRVQVDTLPAAETIETYLAAVLGQDIMVSMYLGPPRANRKPVLQVLTPDGNPVAFAKVGINALTCRLVRAERDALARLDKADLADISLPRVLHHDQWHGLEVLVLTANENQPVNLIEAMAFGLPVLTTRWRSLPEALPPGYTGLRDVPRLRPAGAERAADRLDPHPRCHGRVRGDQHLPAGRPVPVRPPAGAGVAPVLVRRGQP